MYEKPECDLCDLLMDISDPWDRARTARAYGLVDWPECCRKPDEGNDGDECVDA